MATLLSVNVGLPKDVTWQGRTVHTGVWKHPVAGPTTVRRLNVDGDGQGDRQGHGGEMRAVLVYQMRSYEYWQKHFGRDDFEFGQFGENFTVDGLPDDEVCIGDRYRIGEAEFEVTQPRVTCYRVGMRLGEPELPSLLVSHHRPGFYLRVLTEGRVAAGDDIVRTAEGPGGLSVADTDALLYLPGRDRATLLKALAIPALSPGWRGSFSDLVRAGDAQDTALPPNGTGAAWAGFRPLRVVRTVPETASVVSLHLRADDGASLPAARAGQYLTLRVPAAGDPVPVRSYSLSSAPGASEYRLSVKREELGRVSTYLHTAPGAGTVLEAAAPRGDFVLAGDSSPVVLISAGIGVTPLISMLQQLSAERTHRPVWWIHTARRRSDHAFAEEAHRLLTSLRDAHEHSFYTAQSPGDPLPPGARRGRITADSLRDLRIPADATAYLCGPDAFMAAVRGALEEYGLPPGNVRSELFGARGPVNPGVVGRPRPAPHLPAGTPGTGPQVTFARSGISAPWSSAYGSMLDLAEACDVSTRFACRTGVCHTCATSLLTGTVGYSPQPLDPPADGEVLLCCAQPRAEVVLDL